MTRICITFLSILSTCIAVYSHTVLSQQTGTATISEYTYFSLNHQLSKPVAVILTSLQGDCDLYLSQQSTTKRPTFKKHDLGSATCGVDYVVAAQYLKYPLFIGIFGYPSGQDCEFQVEVLLLDIDMEIIESDSDVLFDLESYVGSGKAVKEESKEFNIIWEIMKLLLEVLEVLL